MKNLFLPYHRKLNKEWLVKITKVLDKKKREYIRWRMHQKNAKLYRTLGLDEVQIRRSKAARVSLFFVALLFVLLRCPLLLFAFLFCLFVVVVFVCVVFVLILYHCICAVFGLGAKFERVSLFMHVCVCAMLGARCARFRY